MTNEEKLTYIKEAHELTMRYRLWDMPGTPIEELKRLDDKSWLEFSKLLLPRIPKTFYRYRAFNDNSIDELSNGYAWFSHPEDFDDGTDSALNTDIEKEIEEIENSPEKVITALTKAVLLQQFREITGQDPDESLIQKCVKLMPNGKLDANAMASFLADYYPYLNPAPFVGMIDQYNKTTFDTYIEKPLRKMFDFYLKINEMMRSNLFCLCLAEDYSNDVMWAKYAGERTGFCIGYEIPDSDFIGQKTLTSLNPIYYGEKKPLRFFDFLIDGLTARADDQINGWSKKAYEDIHIAVLTKGPDWLFQKEWRIIFGPEAKTNKQPLPFVKAIYLGEKMPQEHRKVLINIAKANGWKIYERKLNKSGSKIIYSRIGEE